MKNKTTNEQVEHWIDRYDKTIGTWKSLTHEQHNAIVNFCHYEIEKAKIQSYNQGKKDGAEEERAQIRQKLRETDLIDYYCKCNDQGHVISMTRSAYDDILQVLTKHK